MGKKPTIYVAGQYRRELAKLSKAALTDIAWNLALIGTDESPGQVFAHLSREAVIVADGRGDALPASMSAAAQTRIDSDPPE